MIDTVIQDSYNRAIQKVREILEDTNLSEKEKFLHVFMNLKIDKDI